MCRLHLLSSKSRAWRGRARFGRRAEAVEGFRELVGGLQRGGTQTFRGQTPEDQESSQNNADLHFNVETKQHNVLQALPQWGGTDISWPDARSSDPRFQIVFWSAASRTAFLFAPETRKGRCTRSLLHLKQCPPKWDPKRGI